MMVDPAIAGLRSEGAPQPRLDAALARWRGLPEVASLRADLAAYGAGAALAGLPALARLLADHSAGSALAEGFIAALREALTAEPLAQIPLGHSTAPGMARLRLAESGRASLTLAVYAPRALRYPASVLFEDGEAHELVLAGEGQGVHYRQTTGAPETTAFACPPGIRMVRKDAGEARQIIAVARPLLVLQLVREAEQPAPSREVAVADGALLKRISGCKRTSQQMMALGVLGALGHCPALGAMERMALDGAAERDLRWEALRQVLGLDTARGLAVLEALAARRGDALGAPAAKLRRDLAADHPELAQLEPV